MVRDPNLATSDGDDDDDDFNLFVFKSEGVEVRVPRAFLSSSDALGCGSVVAAGIAVDYAATQMFPFSPPSPQELQEEGEDGDNVVQNGLHGVLVDFTSVGVALPQEGSRDTFDRNYDDDVVIIFDHIRRVSTFFYQLTYFT